MKNPSLISNPDIEQLIWISEESVSVAAIAESTSTPFAPLQPMRQWLDSVSFQTPETARLLCQIIPARCPFERTVRLFGLTLFHIPPLCKLNPFYEQVVGLRFRALCYLADDCGEDVTHFC